MEQNSEKELALITLVVLSLELGNKLRIQGWSLGMWKIKLGKVG